jgi:hypothetical protein
MFGVLLTFGGSGPFLLAGGSEETFFDFFRLLCPDGFGTSDCLS